MFENFDSLHMKIIINYKIQLDTIIWNLSHLQFLLKYYILTEQTLDTKTNSLVNPPRHDLRWNWIDSNNIFILQTCIDKMTLNFSQIHKLQLVFVQLTLKRRYPFI